MKPLTIVYITGRKRPKTRWLYESLENQSDLEPLDIIVIDSNISTPSHQEWMFKNFTTNGVKYPPKPTVWQGAQRLTKQDWWAAANARNTGICLCETEWIAFLDDRCVLLPGWLESIKQAMEGNYAVFGAYEKRIGMTVENSQIIYPGEVIGQDDREIYTKRNWGGSAPVTCGGEWSFGCNLALPLEWVLEVGGFDETCDGTGMEDIIFGLMLQAHGFPCKYDYRMKVIQDRTPSELGVAMRKEDYGISPNDWSHKLLKQLQGCRTAQHGFDIRKLREHKLGGGDWPPPWGPAHHGWNNVPLEEL